MKKYGLNNGYIGKDRLRSFASGVLSQHKHASLRQGNLMRIAGSGVVKEGLRINYSVESVSDQYPETWPDSSGVGVNATMLGSPELVETSGINYLAFDAVADGFEPSSGYSFTNGTGTVALVIKTVDVQGLFFGNFLGAYRAGNKFYNNGFGSPTFHMDTVQKTNIYDHLRTGNWHYVEFKNVQNSSTTVATWRFSKYGSYEIQCDLRAVIAYDHTLTSEESQQNYNFYLNSGFLSD